MMLKAKFKHQRRGQTNNMKEVMKNQNDEVKRKPNKNGKAKN